MQSRSTLQGCGIAVLVLVAVVLALMMAVGFGIQTGFLPDSAARPAGKIPSRQLRQLQQMGVTQPGEKVFFFYSTALLGIRGDGNLFTDRRVISYYENEGKLDISEATYDEIESIDFEPGDTWLDDATITVTKKDGTWFVLYVSAESNGDKLFHRKLVEEWNKHRNSEKPTEDL